MVLKWELTVERKGSIDNINQGWAEVAPYS